VNRTQVVFDLYPGGMVRVWSDYGSGIVPSADYETGETVENPPGTYAIVFVSETKNAKIGGSDSDEFISATMVTGYEMYRFTPDVGVGDSVDLSEGFADCLWRLWSVYLLMR